MRSLLNLISTISFGRLRVRVTGHADELFLTFDDGPDPLHTLRLLEVLSRHGAKATFFMIGSRARMYPHVVRAVHDAGHALGNHSDSHPWFDRLSWKKQLQEVHATDDELKQVDGRSRHHFRPPHGRLSLGCLWHMLMGRLRITLWSVDSNDYRLSPPAVESRFRNLDVRAGDIVLFHDDGDTAAESLDRLIPQWQARGLRCTTLPDTMAGPMPVAPMRKKERLARGAASTGLFRVSRAVGRMVRDRLMILAYHRVVPAADEARWPFDIELVSASPADFRWQMQFVARHLRPVTLTDVVNAAAGGPELPRGAVLVTFDDGFADNYQHAFPILKEVGVPACVFVATDLIGTNEQFWFESVAQLVMSAPHHTVLEPAPGLTFDVTGGPTHRRRVLRELLSFLKQQPDDRRRAMVSALRASYGSPLDASTAELSRTLSWAEVRSMAAGGVEFGSHGASHGLLSHMSASELSADLRRSKQRLETELGMAPRAIAYPVGGHSAFDDAVIDAVRREGFSVGMSYIPGVNRRRRFDAYRLRRQHVERFTTRPYFEGLLSLPSVMR